MVKAVIWVAMVAVAVVLIVLAGLNPPNEIIAQPDIPVIVVPDQPVVYPEIVEKVTPEVPEAKTPKAEEVVNIAPEFKDLVPSETRFFVNEIEVPPFSSSYYNYIPLKEHDLKSFAGSFGPYSKNPIPYINVKLCAENYKVSNPAPVCQPVELIFRQGMVSFAVGLQYDEYIGGMAAKDYLAYYTITSGDANAGESNKAVIRTVKD